MRLANLGGRAIVVVPGADDKGVDVATVSNGRFGPGIQALYDDWDEFRDFVGGLDLSSAATVAIDPTRLRAPTPNPRQVFGIGLNYRSHAAESGMEVPKVPATFTKFPTCLTGPFADVTLSSGSVDWEVELVMIVGRRAENVDAGDGWDHVAGLTIGQDVSDRALQFAAGGQFSLGKSYPGFGPLGPWLVTPDELAEPDDLALGCSIDGETVQDARTSDLVFGVPELVAELSAVVPLLPGDIVFTGTPAGVGFTRQPPRFLQPGETVESWIEGIGRMRTRFVGPDAPEGGDHAG